MKTGLVLRLLLSGAAGAGGILLAHPGGTFTPTGSMTTARNSHTATLLLDGRVLIAGGDHANRLSLAAELYDPASGTFTATGNMAAPHSVAVLLNTGKVLMGPPAPDGTAELFDPSSGTFTATGGYAGANPPWLDEDHAFLLPNGSVLMMSTGCPAELYDPETGTFRVAGGFSNCCSPVDGDDQANDAGVSGTFLANGKILFAGIFANRGPSSWASLYDPSTATGTRTDNMTEGRNGHTATLLPDGSVLIAGGGVENFPPYGYDATAEVYDPSTGAFRPIGRMTAGRWQHRATLLNDGRILITGGFYRPSSPGPRITLSTAQLYMPPVLTPAPVLFSVSGDRREQGAIWPILDVQATR